MAALREAGRQPRLEYVTACAPGLETLLAAAGFRVEARHDYLVCTPETFTQPPGPDGLHLSEPDTDPRRAAMVAAQNEAFGGAPTATGEDVARVRRLQAGEGAAVMAVTGDGVSEVGGIATGRPTGGVGWPRDHRGRHGALVRRWRRHGVARGLGEDSWRVYERVGYRVTGRRLYTALD